MTEKLIYLLITGAIPEAMVEEAAKYGVVLDPLEYIRTDSLIDIPGIGQLASRRLTVVFTSVNAVTSVERWVKGGIPDWRIYCISGATCDAVIRQFGKEAVAGTADSASQLAELIGKREAEQGSGIVFFCGDHRRDDLPSIGVKEIVVYRTVLTPRRIGREYDGIAFFSPSAVESFFSVNEIRPEIPLFAIGATTAAAIRNRCGNQVMVAERPEKTWLIRQMIDHFLNTR